MKVLLFALVAVSVLAVVAGVHRYLWVRLVRDTTTPGSRARRLGTAAAWTLPVVMVGSLVGLRAGVPFWLQRVLAWPGYMWMATLLYLTLALLVGEAARPLLRRLLERRDGRRAAAAAPAAELVGVPAGERPAAGPAAGPQEPVDGAGPGLGEAVEGESRDLPRRLFVARTVGAAALFAATATVGYGTYGVLSGPRIKRITVPLAKLPRSAHGLRIAVVSDIHLSPVLGRAHAQRITDRINSVQADLVTVVGDLVDGDVGDLGPAAEPLAHIRSRLGTYFVTGNHEYFSGAQQWVDHVRELGLRPLENDRVELPGFDLACVNDLAGESEGQGPDFARALGDRDTSRASVLMAHQPVVVHDAVKYGVDLQLSGHTHGGQLWPGNYLAELANPTVAGLDRYGDTQLYVTRGAGSWGPPVRVGAPSDITVVELASKQA
ncbi:metallophosphoesterase [Streptomyces sp. NPDC006879]|uniref:metallophosphoesterase n=1 Tax=Streptomyces sp. NPDC006879 TaxID=3364767 RepID=UPI0036CB6236